MIVKCVWEHNGNDTLLYAVDFVGAYTRGESLDAAIAKMPAEITSYFKWFGKDVPDDMSIEIVQEKVSDLRISDADSDVIFDSERETLTLEEYNELNEAYKELLAQRDDLYKAQEDLQKVIDDLTKEMTLTFNEGFKTIKSNFTRIFKELFGGGTADLIVEESLTGDPLDAGIEIVAEPPGKKLQKISLLSGGEMSLTAIAILFAILRLRPMPFCVLDEIEAALDDANVERFAKYLRNFSKETQFICITHKKVTMENADGLFGVTMPEKGVSSIVSVKLADVAQIEDFKN